VRTLKAIGLGLAGLLGLGVLAIWAFGDRDISAEDLRARYANAASQFIELESGTLAHVRDQGRRDAPALVLLHGSNASLHTFEPWVAMLKDDFRIITMDLLGHGLIGAFSGYKSGHELNILLLRELLLRPSAWEEITFDDPEIIPVSYAHPAHAN
jgi:hypothetical protein